MKKRGILMLPGPNEPYPEILDELKKMILPHYGEDWDEVYIKTCEEMKEVFLTANSQVIIWPGSGASAIELVVANLLDEGDKIINLKNGFFGDFFESKTRSYGGKVINVESEFGKSVKPEFVRHIVKENPDAKAIFVVQSETSSGTLNPIKEIGEIAEETNKLLVVDAISSLGGTELRMDKWGVDVCIGYASKCLGSIGVLSPIAFSERVWNLAEKTGREVKPYFLSLKAWKTMRWGGPHPLTMPTLNVLALRIAIHLALKEGLENRFRRHHTVGRAFREGVRAMGLEVLPTEQEAADSVTAVLVPSGMESRVRALLREEYNIIVGGSLGSYGKDRLLRVGHMGLTASPEYVVPTLYALEQVMKKVGVDVREGEAVKTAIEIFKSKPNEWINALLARYNLKSLPDL
ncbi:MAG: alanine--glyoxylate aminotransferase family protein [Candidatus Bathyarchaeia archaeon]